MTDRSRPSSATSGLMIWMAIWMAPSSEAWASPAAGTSRHAFSQNTLALNQSLSPQPQPADGTASDTEEELTQIELALRLPETLGASYTGLGPFVSHVYFSRTPQTMGALVDLRWERFDGDRLRASADASMIQTTFARVLASFGARLSQRLVAQFGLAVTEEYQNFFSGIDANGTSVDYVTLDYIWGEESGIRFGRFIMPIGLWNLRFEASENLRILPSLAETVIIPPHWREQGILIYGRLNRMLLQGGISSALNARGFQSETWISEGRDEANRRSSEGMGAFLRFDWSDFASKPASDFTSGFASDFSRDGLQIGASAFIGESHQGDARLGQARVQLWELHAQTNLGRFKSRLLYADGTLSDSERITAVTGRRIGRRAQGYDIEIAFDVFPNLAPLGNHWIQRRLPPDWRSLPIFIAHSMAHPAAEISDVSAEGERAASRVSAWTVGAVYKPHPQVTLKSEIAAEKKESGPSGTSYRLGLGFYF